MVPWRCWRRSFRMLNRATWVAGSAAKACKARQSWHVHVSVTGCAQSFGGSGRTPLRASRNSTVCCHSFARSASEMRVSPFRPCLASTGASSVSGANSCRVRDQCLDGLSRQAGEVEITERIDEHPDGGGIQGPGLSIRVPLVVGQERVIGSNS